MNMGIFQLPRWARVLAVLLGLAGCAAPRYETIVHREKPTGASAQFCLESCERGLDGCKQKCAEKYQACLKQVAPEAEEHYTQTLNRYAEALERYRRDLTSYEFQLWVNFNMGRGAYWYDPFPFPHALPPSAPRAPSREEDLNRLRDARCGGDCGCQPPFDTCFLACGGKISTEQRCASNCPDGR